MEHPTDWVREFKSQFGKDTGQLSPSELAMPQEQHSSPLVLESARLRTFLQCKLWIGDHLTRPRSPDTHVLGEAIPSVEGGPGTPQ